jgi:hypothetical protein
MRRIRRICENFGGTGWQVAESGQVEERARHEGRPETRDIPTRFKLWLSLEWRVFVNMFGCGATNA